MTHISYFLTGNTAKGHMSLIQQSLSRVNSLIVIDGPFLTDNGNVLQRLYEEISTQIKELELIYHPSAPSQLQGMIIPTLRIAFFSSTPDHRVPYEQHTGFVTILNMYDYYDTKVITSHQTEIDNLTTAIIEKHQEAYLGYAKALEIHDEWEKIYIEQIDFAKANAFASELAEKLLPEAKAKAELQSSQLTPQPIYRFLGAATPQGAVDFVPELTKGLKRYLIKGRPGSGKSTLLRKLLARGQELGYELEVYQCGLDPNSLDMIICRELGFAIFDSTAPHEYEPTEETDEVIDMYAIAINPDTDERFKTELRGIASQYRTQMNASTAALAQAAELENKLANITKAALNEQSLKQSEQLLINSVLSLQKQLNQLN